MDQEKEDIDRQIEEISEQIERLHKKCHYRSVMRLTREKKRLAKAEHRLIPYLHGCFMLTNSARDTFEVEVGVEAAIEIITFLESEEKSRRFQPDFPEDSYYYTLSWMSACAYDNLATHVASRDGYNSDGVHDAIEDGIQVCRRTGKLQCIPCFREYATDVFIAAGDLDMAMHHARTVATGLPIVEEGGDRRWSGSNSIVEILKYQGHLETALEAARKSLVMTSTFHSPLFARFKTRAMLEEVLLMLGRHGEYQSICAETGCPVEADETPPKDEFPLLDYYQALRDALDGCCRGDTAEAIRLLSDWDRRLTDLHHLSAWFETRLRLVAAHYLAGDMERTHALARQLESRAKKARNWLTLERLRGLLDGKVHPSPLALLSSATAGPFAAPQMVKAVTDSTSGVSDGVPAGDTASTESSSEPVATSNDGGQSNASEEPESPHAELIKTFMKKITQIGDDESAANGVLDDLLRLQPEQITDEVCATWMLYLAGFPLRVTGRAAETWAWAEALANRFPQSGTALNLLADLGFSCRSILGENADQVVAEAKVESLFKSSLEMELTRAKNFARAGCFYLELGRRGEAERCFAQGFRLDRSLPILAGNLAEIYNDSDRPQDAAAVLDLSIRAGCQDPDIVWEAGTTAMQLKRFDSALTYFDFYETLAPERMWTQYYRAWSLLETKRPQEALDALEIESRRVENAVRLNIEVLRAWAMIQLNNLDGFRGHFRQAMAIPTAQIDHLTVTGISRLLTKCYEITKDSPETAAEFECIRQRLLECGLATSDLFRDARKGKEEIADIHYFIIQVRQPLDERWVASSGCLPGQSDWKEYFCNWGVLAVEEEEANREVLAWQQQCYPVPAEIIECDLQEETYNNAPGVVWQGFHEEAE